MPNGYEVKNATQKPRMYYARHLFPGVAEYQNERIHVDMPAMKKMAKSMEGCPIYVKHQEVDLENIQNADGFVSDNFINPHDGWMWSKFVAVSDAAHEAIAKGWKVSNAYIPTELGGAGTQHNVDYNRKVLNAKFTHLAIVPNPRYEEAKIFTPEQYKEYNQVLKESELTNSKTKTGNSTMNLFKLVKTAVTGDAVDDDTFIELKDGSTKSLKDIKNDLENEAEAEKAAAAEAAKKTATETEKQNAKITVAGVEMTVAEAAEKYNALMEKKCAADKMAAKKKKDDEDEEEEKKNAANLQALVNASEKKTVVNSGPVIETDSDKLARGKQLY